MSTFAPITESIPPSITPVDPIPDTPVPAPVGIPDAPVPAPVGVPDAPAPVDTPDLTPVEAPIPAPVDAPTPAPVDAPIPAPVDVPTPKSPVEDTPTTPAPVDAGDDSLSPSKSPLPAPFDVSSPIISPTPSPIISPTLLPYAQPDRDSLAPHKQTFVDKLGAYGTYEKEGVDKLSGVEIFAITASVLVVVCILGFCFGRKCTLWCNRSRNQMSPIMGQEPFSPAEQEML